MSIAKKSGKNIKYVGLDDGHSGTKVFAGYDSVTKEPIQKMIPSIVRKGDNQFTQVDQDKLDDATIIVDGENYIVGSEFAGNGDDIVGDQYPTSGHNVALITQILRSFIESWGSKPIDLGIVTGLPLGHYFDKVNDTPNIDLINAKKKNIERLESAYSPADKTKNLFKLTKNSVQPEGWGSFIDAILTDKGATTERFDIIKEYGVVIVDIGGRTVDAMVLEAEAMSAKYENIHTYNSGILYMQRKLNNIIVEKEGASKAIKRSKIEELIRTGKYGRTEAKARDYSDIVEKVLEDHTKEIFERIKPVIDSSEAEGGVIITGGGAELLGERLKTLVEAHNNRAEVTVPIDPVFSNARGFWKLCRYTN